MVSHNDICASELFLLLHSKGNRICVDLWLECIASFLIDLLSEDVLPLRLLLAVVVEVVKALALPWLQVLVARCVLERVLTFQGLGHCSQSGEYALSVQVCRL